MNTSQFFKPSRRGGGGGLKSREITTLNCSRVVTRKPQHHAHNDLRITSLEADVVHKSLHLLPLPYMRRASLFQRMHVHLLRTTLCLSARLSFNFVSYYTCTRRTNESFEELHVSDS